MAQHKELPQAPSVYNIMTDQIEQVTQNQVDEWTQVAAAYGELRQALARAEVDQGLGAEPALSDLLRTADEIQTKLKEAISHG